ncbi:MAG: PLDc N-terminal domain-containing protein, partial [Clostridia bacterium]|nr:PLDc N-terminal domain-containing protein [Clostridia bacterium]
MRNRRVDASRFAVIAFSIIIQAIVVWLLVYLLNKVFVYAQIVTTAIGVVLFLSIVNRDQPAVYKVPWIILFLLIPFAGLMVYVTFGNVKLTRRQRKKFRRIFDENHDGYYNQEQVLRRLEEDGGKGLGIVKYLKSATSLPVFSNSFTEYYPTCEKFYKKLKEELSKAEKYIFMEYFIVQEGVMWQGIFDILKKKVKSGVQVYLMYDDVGSMSKVSPDFDKYLQRKGINAVKFNKFHPVISISHNNRDHRKMTIIDGK